MKIFQSFIFLITMTVAVYSVPFNTQRGGHCYTLDIPDYMESTFDLNDVATLQYQNGAKEAYTIVIEDSKKRLYDMGIVFNNTNEFLKGFTDTYMIDSPGRTLSDITEFKANGNNHSQVEMIWNHEGNLFFMIITVVETKTHFYKILSWSLEANKNIQKDDFIKISKSLKD